MAIPPKAFDRPHTDKVKRHELPRLESVAEAEARNLTRIDALFDREPEIAVKLEACARGARCGTLACAVCARRFRFALIRETLRIARLEVGHHQWATIHLETIPVGSLPDVSVKRARERLRQRLQRTGFHGSILIGLIEVSWLARDRVWLLHVHVVAIHVLPEAWDALEKKLAKSGRADPLDVDDLEDPERQISYSFKFVTYHRPGKNGREGRARAYPLPPDRLAELATWWSRYTFDDLVFLYGARRRGGRIVPED
jgi:hypothetical protein